MRRIKGKMNLAVNEDKMGMRRLPSGEFDFLGWTVSIAVIGLRVW